MGLITSTASRLVIFSLAIKDCYAANIEEGMSSRKMPQTLLQLNYFVFIIY